MGWVWKRLSAAVAHHPGRLLVVMAGIVALLAVGLPAWSS